MRSQRFAQFRVIGNYDWLCLGRCQAGNHWRQLALHLVKVLGELHAKRHCRPLDFFAVQHFAAHTVQLNVKFFDLPPDFLNLVPFLCAWLCFVAAFGGAVFPRFSDCFERVEVRSPRASFCYGDADEKISRLVVAHV